MSDAALKMTHHSFDSQKNESLNRRVMSVAPKSKTFCKTMSLSYRISLIVIVDSIGYTQGLLQVLSKLCGATFSFLPVLEKWAMTKDTRASQKKTHEESKPTKLARTLQQKQNIKAELERDIKSKK